MVQLPEMNLTEEQKYELLYKWYSKKEELARVQAQERALRQSVVSVFFPDGLNENTNKIKLDTGDDLVVTQPYTRKVDKAIFSQILPDLIKAGVDVNEVTETKVELRVAAYRKLTAEQLAIFDECVTTTLGSPQVKIAVKKG
ncbi:putative DNA binding protein [Enterobacteria phage 9g]|uniref:Putative DNA binding protein n=1 Tax=Enterobacteria phage 9g TaxID=1468411 RepID=X2KSQ2_9CAUD|nr:putative DNA binding protein [Enterobacteria phage 9g]AHN84533.1 putative DNA binding protein [Enterobacteria phage 9g]